MIYTATFTIGPHDVIEHVNDAACDLVGYSRGELVGMHGAELVPLERQGRTAVSLDQMRLGTLVFRDGVLRHKNGTILPIEVAAEILDGERLALHVRLRSER